MLNEFLKTVVVESFTATDGGANGPVVFTSTGDKYIFTALRPVRLMKWGFFVANVAIAQTASAMALQLALRVTAGTDTGRVALDTLTTTAASAFALGTGGYRDYWTPATSSLAIQSQVPAAGPLGDQGTFPVVSGQIQAQLSVGQQWVISVQTASDNTGQGKLFMEYVLLPITRPSGYGVTNAGTVSLDDNYTRFAS